MRPFESQFFEEYKSWFNDQVLSSSLGGIDDEWLEHVLNSKAGDEWMVFDGNLLISVVGVIHPKLGYNYYTISNIAINPSLRLNGYGLKAIEKVIKKYSLNRGQHWVAFVEHDNKGAFAFFNKLGWKNKGLDETDMFVFTYR